MHLKRNKIPKFWQIPRKGTKYLSVSSHNSNDSVPLAVAMRDILGIVRNKKELKRILNEKKVLVNQKMIVETNYPISLFDVINLPEIKKNYKAILSPKKKLIFEEIGEKDSSTKIFKVIGRKMLPGKKMQINLMHGQNIISNEKLNSGDSVILNLKENKILKVIPLEKGRKAFIIKGKHAGSEGNIGEIISRGGKTIAKISSHKHKINVWVKNLIVIE